MTRQDDVRDYNIKHEVIEDPDQYDVILDRLDRIEKAIWPLDDDAQRVKFTLSSHVDLDKPVSDEDKARRIIPPGTVTIQGEALFQQSKWGCIERCAHPPCVVHSVERPDTCISRDTGPCKWAWLERITPAE